MGAKYSSRPATMSSVQSVPKFVFEKSSNKVKFFAISDFGRECVEIKQLAAAMDRYATLHGPPDFILGLGDNFYPGGAESGEDSIFQRVWRAQFLDPYPSLRVPWRMILGNHDYYDNPHAEIDYHHNKELNEDGLWFLPDQMYMCTEIRNKGSSREGSFSVDLFGLDTNGCDEEIQYMYPDSILSLRDGITLLSSEMKKSSARWKIVYGHHPLYTAGRGHGRAGDRLRESRAYEYQGQQLPGFGLEKVLSRCQVDGFYAGHEHVFQYHGAHGVHHFCCGASGAEQRPNSGLYAGRNPAARLDWIGRASQVGFVVTEIEYDRMTTQFVGLDGEAMKVVTVTKE